MKPTVQHLSFVLATILGVATIHLPCASAANGPLTVTVTRRDLRPLSGVILQLAGAVNLQRVTDNNGHAAFADLPAAGAVTITPSRSGFRFEPPQINLANIGNAAEAAFAAVPAATDLALTMTVDTDTPLVGGMVNEVITVRNLGAEAATDIVIGFNSLPGLVLEDRHATAGQLSSRMYDTAWKLPQLNPGAASEVHARSRATLPDANVLVVAMIEEMDQTDLDPASNSTLMTVRPRPAQAQLALTMTIIPGYSQSGRSGAGPAHAAQRRPGRRDSGRDSELSAAGGLPVRRARSLRPPPYHDDSKAGGGRANATWRDVVGASARQCARRRRAGSGGRR